jgi:hypothetical protein
MQWAQELLGNGVVDGLGHAESLARVPDHICSPFCFSLSPLMLDQASRSTAPRLRAFFALGFKAVLDKASGGEPVL